MGQVCIAVTFRQSSGTGVSICHILAQYLDRYATCYILTLQWDRCLYLSHFCIVFGQVFLPVTFRQSSGTGVPTCYI